MRPKLLLLFLLAAVVTAVWLGARPAAGDDLIDGFRLVEAASVADAVEQLYGRRAHMSHDMRPVFTTRFAGPAVTVLMKKEEHKDGAAASQGMLDAIDSAPPGRFSSWCCLTASITRRWAASWLPP